MSYYEDEYSSRNGRRSAEIEVVPTLKGYQLIGDSQFLRFAEQLLQKRRKKTNGLAYLGLCVSGQKTGELLKRVREKFHPTLKKVILMIGTNDLLKNTHCALIKDDLRELVCHLLREGCKIILLTIPPVPRLAKSENHWNTLKEYNSFIKNFHNGKDIFVVDAYPKFIKSDDLSHSSPLSSSRASLVSDSSISSPVSRSSLTPSFFTSNFGKIRTNLRIQVGDDSRNIYVTRPDSDDDDDDDKESQDSSYSSLHSTPCNKRSSFSSGFRTPNPKRRSYESSYSPAEDDHDDRFYSNDSISDNQFEEINTEYFEEFFGNNSKRQDLIHLNNRGLRLIQNLILEEIESRNFRH